MLIMLFLYLFQTNGCRTDLWWLCPGNFWPSQEDPGSCWGERSEMHHDPGCQQPSHQCRSSATHPLRPYSHTRSPEWAPSWGGQQRQFMSKNMPQPSVSLNMRLSNQHSGKTNNSPCILFNNCSIIQCCGGSVELIDPNFVTTSDCLWHFATEIHRYNV